MVALVLVVELAGTSVLPITLEMVASVVLLV
jgi:hypothetical protein